MKKMLLSILLLLALPLCAQAMGFEIIDHHWIAVGTDGMRYGLKNTADWIFVTAENVEEYMELCTAGGDSEEAVRMRFATGHVVFEAHHPKYPDLRFRVEAYEDDFTRDVWNLKSRKDSQNSEASEYIKTEWLRDHYLFQHAIAETITVRTNCTTRVRFISLPPYDYESGNGELYFYNGVCYFFIFSSPNCIWETYVGKSYYTGFTNMGYYGSAENLEYFIGELRTPVTDLSDAYDYTIFNAHSGAFSYGGKSEKGAVVDVTADGNTARATTDADGVFTYTVDIESNGMVRVDYAASKEGLVDRAFTTYVPVNDTIAALMLKEYPLDKVEAKEIKITGKANPGAQVTVQIDEETPLILEAKADGVFTYKFTTAPYQNHTMTLTVSEEGLEDCTVKTPFWPEYQEDINRAISAYKKTLEPTISLKKIQADPAAWVGKRIQLETKLEGRQFYEGGNTFTLRERDGTPYLMLVLDGYIDDKQGNANLTILGEVLEPTKTDPAIPRIRIDVMFTYVSR